MSAPDEAVVAAGAWERGRFDARRGPQKVLFGRMYEDPSVELAAFPPGGRVLCIASAGCTAMALAPRHEVTAVDINPVQLEYAARRISGEPAIQGAAERIMGVGRALTPLLGWRRARLEEFLAQEETAAQTALWHAHLDTRRFRFMFDGLLSFTALRAAYASSFLSFLPKRFGAALRGRLERCFARHPNRTNPYARLLFRGEARDEPPPPEAKRIRLVHADAAGFLEGGPAAGFDGYTLSNILDGADPSYRRRLFAAVKRAARPGAQVVLRTFGDPDGPSEWNRAAHDRSMLWGIVDVRPAEAL